MRCDQCHGAGWYAGMGSEGNPEQFQCEACHGTGEINHHQTQEMDTKKKITSATELALPEVEGQQPLDLFQDTNLKRLVEVTEAEIRSLVPPDPADKQGHALIGSIGKKISSLKVAIDSRGKELVEPLKKQAKEIDSLRKFAKDRLDALRRDWMAPREEHDAALAAAEKRRAETEAFIRNAPLEIGRYSKPSVEQFDKTERDLKEIILADIWADPEKLREMDLERERSLQLVAAKRREWQEEQELIRKGREAAAQPQPGPAPVDKPASVPDPDKEHKIKVHHAIVEHLGRAPYNIDSATAFEIIKGLYTGEIPHLRIDYGPRD